MSATHYNGSKGPVLIAGMPTPHLRAAYAKLEREGLADARADEFAAMGAEIAKRDEEQAEEQARGDAEEGRSPVEADLPASHLPGANNPPPDSPYEAVKANMDDYLTEARNWADGVAIENQAQADEVERLIEDLRLAMVAADGARVTEKAPLDEKIAEIQDRYNVYIAPLKNKKPGKVPVAMEALRAVLTPWKLKLDKERQDAAERARAAAQKAADEAAAAIRAAAPTDLAAREEAEELVTVATQAAAVAKRVGAVKTTGLRSFWSAIMTDRRAALVHYLTTNPDAVAAFIQTLADQDVRAGKRQIPGFEVREEKRAA